MKGGLIDIRRLRSSPFFARVLKNSGWVFGSQTVAYLGAFCQGIILARFLGPSDYGRLALVLTIVLAINQLFDSRSWEATIKYVAVYRAEGRVDKAAAVSKLALIVDSVTCVIAFAVLFSLATLASHYFLKNEADANLVRLTSVIILFGIPNSVTISVLRLSDAYSWITYEKASNVAIRLAGVVIVVALGMKLADVLLVYVGAAAVSMSIYVVMLTKGAKRLGLPNLLTAKIASVSGELREIVPFLFYSNLNATFKLMQRNVDILLIGYFLVPAQVGLYKIARNLTDLFMFPVDPVNTVLYPEFADLFATKKAREARRIFRRVMWGFGSWAAVSLIVVILLGAVGVRVLYGARYLGAVPVLDWLAVGVAIGIASSSLYPMIVAMGDVRTATVSIATGSVAQIGVLALLLPRIGIVAGGVAYIVCYAIWSFIMTTSYSVSRRENRA